MVLLCHKGIRCPLKVTCWEMVCIMIKSKIDLTDLLSIKDTMMAVRGQLFKTENFFGSLL